MENFFSSATEQPKPTGKPSSKTMWIGAIVAIILVGAVLYWWFKPRADHVTAMGPYILNDSSKVNKNSTETIFSQPDVETNLGNNFTLSYFVYMDDVNRERIPIGGPEGDFRFKPLVYILGVGDILIDPIHQIGRVRIKPLDQSGVIDRQGIVTIDIDNFMISRWNNLTITMEGRSVDVYLNGSIVNSALLENLPVLKPLGVLLEKSPDFAGQAGLFQAWPRRLSEHEIIRNYKRNTDTRGKPLIPDIGPSFFEIFKDMGKGLCDIGFCGFRFRTGPMEYVDYEFA
jgi:hypothetical protein